MRRFAIASLLVSVVAALAAFGFMAQDEQLDGKQLRTRLTQLGYEVKDLNTEAGKEKYEVKIAKGGYDIFVSYEVSPSKNYVWLTVNLGDPPTESSILNNAFLKENGKIQPSQFYITSGGKLMMGLPVDNRNVSNATLRQRTDSITENVVKTVSLWGG